MIRQGQYLHVNISNKLYQQVLCMPGIFCTFSRSSHVSQLVGDELATIGRDYSVVKKYGDDKVFLLSVKSGPH